MYHLASRNISSRFQWCVLDDLHGSDHFPIAIDVLINKISRSKRPKWILSKADWIDFSKNVIINYNNGTINNSIEERVNHITKSIFNAAESTIPRTNSKSSRVPVPWWNDEIKYAIKARKKALRLFRLHPNDNNFILFKKYKAKCRYLTNISKKKSWESFVPSITITTPLSTVFNKIQKISGISKNIYSPILIINGISYSDPFDVAMKIGESFQSNNSSIHFSNKFKSIQRKQQTISFNINNDKSLDYNLSFNMHEFNAAISSCKGSSPGPDDISYEMIKNLDITIKHHLLDIYNSIWNEGIFPTSWTNALVIPILKPNCDPNDPNSYRPISLTSCLCKIFERMINRRLVWYLEDLHLIDNRQCGFRKSRSTIDHHVTLENTIQRAYLDLKHVGVVFFDIKKAYDRVWRKGITEILYSWGIKGKMLVFINNFLNKRYF